MDLDLRLVRAFVLVAEEEHVGRAADRLFVSQPALSKQVRRLEALVGVPLLERVGRNVRPTAAGRVFASEGRALLQRADRMMALTRHAGSEAESAVRIAFVPPLPVEISDLLNDAPGPVTLRRVDWVSQGVVLREGRADLCVLRLPVDADELRYTVVWSEPRVAGFRSSHRLAGRREISIDELGDEPIVDLPSHRDYWAVNPRPDGREPLWGPEVTSVEEMLEVVASGRAMCITGASVASFYRRPDVVFVPLRGVSPSEIAIAWHPEAVTPEARAIVDRLRGAGTADHVLRTGEPSSHP